MLNKVENKVMLAILSECKDRGALLISPLDLIKIVDLPTLSIKELDEIINALALDGYFDLVYSIRHDEKVYCITLLDKGKAYLRSGKIMRRNLLFRVGITALLAVVSFIIGVILKAIFT